MVEQPAGIEVDPVRLAARASAEFELIFSVGTGKPSGVPRPVVNSRTVAPAATSAVEEIAVVAGRFEQREPAARSSARHSAAPE